MQSPKKRVKTTKLVDLIVPIGYYPIKIGRKTYPALFMTHGACNCAVSMLDALDRDEEAPTAIDIPHDTLCPANKFEYRDPYRVSPAIAKMAKKQMATFVAFKIDRNYLVDSYAIDASHVELVTNYFKVKAGYDYMVPSRVAEDLQRRLRDWLSGEVDVKRSYSGIRTLGFGLKQSQALGLDDGMTIDRLAGLHEPAKVVTKAATLRAKTLHDYSTSELSMALWRRVYGFLYRKLLTLVGWL